MRTAFIKQLTEEARVNDKIFLIVGDLGFSVVEEFANLFPDRYLNCGIAEQNMAGVAAGLAMEGYNVYIYSIGNFPTLRCMEQIRYDIAYHNLSVKIVAVGGGYAYGSLGPSHHATEELGMLRTIPNLVIAAPGDPVETRGVTSISANYNGPMYLRLGKAGEPIVHNELLNFKIGDILTLKESNSDSAIISTGSMLDYVNTIVTKNSTNTSIYSLPFIKPINRTQLRRIAEKYKNIVTIEEHQLSAGMGSAIIEIVNDMYSNGDLEVYPQIRRIAIDDKFCSISGSQEYLRELANLKL